MGPAVYLVATAVAFYQPWLGLAINCARWILWVRLCYHSKTVDAEMRRRRTTGHHRTASQG